ncbi:Pyridoxamine 5'-phosphate oxidase [Palleronia marisminoris]|uniref:Pyridoxamine 5'-phosphate oxidase n=1 Tax=Palleronia marisminoris TaxID=315423 RepID=A0A1Y5T7F0_9RHOB|nr:pyridoxamine 5'-phosphate oxidase family protein [Palleronia marisminoris]SFH21295.1 Pyridoxamine 5'-phosphate oxidase [Palleronia marisminoris]SLN57309.1 Pyridoxamine 5'-phosphate oxidase [Palleronia marisminoris]
MSDWFETLGGLRGQVWRMLSQGACDPDSALHTAALATTGLGGAAEARMVVLRGASPSDASLEVHTDRASRKVDELQAKPKATLLFWDPVQSLQIRARVDVEILTGPALDNRWNALAEPAARNYGGRPPPSTPMTSAHDYEETTERDRFAVLVGHVTSMDVVHLGKMHRRALFESKDGFAGMWLAP